MIQRSLCKLCPFNNHRQAHSSWKDICEHVNALRQRKSYVPLIAYAKIALNQMARFQANDCPPFYETSLKQEMVQAYAKVGKKEEAVKISKEILAAHDNSHRIEHVQAKQNHGFLLLDKGCLAEVTDAQRIFEGILEPDTIMLENFPLEHIEYQKIIPISKVGLAISFAIQGTRPVEAKFNDNKRVPRRVGIIEKEFVEKAVDLLYRTLPLLYDAEEIFYVALCLTHASLIHEASGSFDKATGTLEKLKSWISEHPSLRENLELLSTDVDIWIRRVQAHKKTKE